jgi:predicted ribosomally synthesized peptide with nif11-like leader
MSEEQLKAFLEKVKGDTSLQEKLKAAAAPEAAADSDAVLAIAKEAGFSISADDLKNAQSEISEEELEGVAGGNMFEVWKKNIEASTTDIKGWGC